MSNNEAHPDVAPTDGSDPETSDQDEAQRALQTENAETSLDQPSQ